MYDAQRQHGGPVGLGGSYLVGEDGPELFTPDRNGMVLSNARTRAMAGAGAPASVQMTNVFNEKIDSMHAMDEVFWRLGVRR